MRFLSMTLVLLATAGCLSTIDGAPPGLIVEDLPDDDRGGREPEAEPEAESPPIDVGGDEEAREPSGPTNRCEYDRDCSAGMACRPETGRCAPAECGEDLDCVPGAVQRACRTDDSGLGRRLCYDVPCSADAACADGRRCRDGVCVQAAAVPAPARIALFIASPVIRAGVGRPVTAVAYAADDSVITSDPRAFSFSTSDSAVAAVDAAGIVTGAAGSGRANVTAAIGGLKSPPLAVYAYGPPAPDRVRVVVLDRAAGVPLDDRADRRVLVRIGDTVLPAGDEAGAGAVEVPSTGPRHDVHIFAEGYGRVSLYGVAGGDIAVPLDPVVTALGGVRGRFRPGLPDDGRPYDAAVTAGFAFDGDLTDLSRRTLTGPQQFRRWEVPGTELKVSGPLGVGIQARAVGRALSPEAIALAPAGRRRLWVIGGPIYYNPAENCGFRKCTFVDDSDETMLSYALAAAVERSNPMLHGVSPPVDVTAVPFVVDERDIDGDGNRDERIPDTDATAAAPANIAYVRKTLSTRLRWAEPPPPLQAADGGKTYPGAIAMAFVHVAGEGLIPLGAAASMGALPADTTLRWAPGHGGAEGTYLFASFTHGFLRPTGDDSVGAVEGAEAAAGLFGAGFLWGPSDSRRSVVLTRVASGTPAPEAVRISGHLDHPAAEIDLAAGRLLVRRASRGPAAHLHRVVLRAGYDTWTVYLRPDEAAVLPPAPDGWAPFAAVEASVQAVVFDDRAGITADNGHDRAAAFDGPITSDWNGLLKAFAVHVP